MARSILVHFGLRQIIIIQAEYEGRIAVFSIGWCWQLFHWGSRVTANTGGVWNKRTTTYTRTGAFVDATLDPATEGTTSEQQRLETCISKAVLEHSYRKLSEVLNL
jgi:hypothetical protein